MLISKICIGKFAGQHQKIVSVLQIFPYKKHNRLVQMGNFLGRPKFLMHDFSLIPIHGIFGSVK